MTGRLWLYVGLVAAAAPAASQVGPSPPAASQAAPVKDWAAIARGDVLAAYGIYVANHPGMHDPANPGFPELLKQAREAGLEAAKQADTPEGYSQALGAFSGIIHDGHALAGMKTPGGGSPTVEWPGFTVAWRGDKAFVRQAASATAPPPGAEITGCGGMDVHDFVKRRMQARPFRPGEGGQWWFWTPRAFTSTPTFRAGRPRSCMIRTAAGEARSVDLAWTPAPKDFDQLLGKATDGERTAIGLSEPRTNIFLIGMPDFQPDDDGVKAYRRLFEELRARRSELNRAKAVVIDLRFNNGGSSEWSKLGAQALWGDAVVEQRMDSYFKNVRIWWRASEGNTAYMNEMVAKLRREGQVENSEAMEIVRNGMRAALAKGEPYYVEVKERKTAQAAATATDFTTPVYVITRGACGSACLDAVDVFTRFSNVKLIGAPTAADSTYMDVRVTDLPSGEGRIVIPNKLWAGRPRASGEVYSPHILVTDLDWSTKTFLDRIEADLTAR